MPAQRHPRLRRRHPGQGLTGGLVAVPVSNEERLFSLVLALLATETGLTKADVLSSVQGYRQRYRPGGNNASLERQFERDKEDVRDLGVPLESIELPADQGASQYTRYRIPKGAYDLPADVTFTPQEIALLNLAALAWREGSLSGESRRALDEAAFARHRLRRAAARLRAAAAGQGCCVRSAVRRDRAAPPGALRLPEARRHADPPPAARPARPRAVRRPLARARHRPALGGGCAPSCSAGSSGPSRRPRSTSRRRPAIRRRMRSPRSARRPPATSRR